MWYVQKDKLFSKKKKNFSSSADIFFLPRKQATEFIYSQIQVDPNREESIRCEYLFF